MATSAGATPVGTSGEPGRQAFTSNVSFVYSAIAASIGLGTLWRFPYVAGTNGGGAFVLLYFAFTLALCVPIVVAEMMIGKKGSGSTVASVNRLVADEGASPFWRTIGWLSLFIPFIGLSYYSVVASWSVNYSGISILQGFEGITGEESVARFRDSVASPWYAGAVQVGFIFAAACVVALGLQKGIERISKFKMIALCIVLAILVSYNAIVIGLGPAIEFLLKPDFGRLDSAAVLAAFGQALFSASIGVGVLMTFSSYVPEGTSTVRSAVVLLGSILCAAIVAGLAIFPIVLNYDLDPSEGANLIFVAMPVAFGQMTGGHLLAIVFFFLLALSAFTCSVAMLQASVSWLEERTSMGRTSLAMLSALILALIGLPSMLSFGILSDLHPLDSIGIFEGKTIFDILDFTIANFLLPLNAILIALFVGWAISSSTTVEEFGKARRLHSAWKWSLRVLAPAAIIILMLSQ